MKIKLGRLCKMAGPHCVPRQHIRDMSTWEGEASLYPTLATVPSPPLGNGKPAGVSVEWFGLAPEVSAERGSISSPRL